MSDRCPHSRIRLTQFCPECFAATPCSVCGKRRDEHPPGEAGPLRCRMLETIR